MNNCHLGGSKNGAVQRTGVSLGLGNVSMKGFLEKAHVASPGLAGLVIPWARGMGFAHQLSRSLRNGL